MTRPGRGLDPRFAQEFKTLSFGKEGRNDQRRPALPIGRRVAEGKNRTVFGEGNEAIG